MKRFGSVEVHLVLAVLALGLAYYVWSAPEKGKKTATGVVVWDLKPEEIAGLTYISERTTVEMTANGEGEDRWYRLTVTTRPLAPKPRPPAPTLAPATAAPATGTVHGTAVAPGTGTAAAPATGKKAPSTASTTPPKPSAAPGTAAARDRGPVPEMITPTATVPEAAKPTKPRAAAAFEPKPTGPATVTPKPTVTIPGPVPGTATIPVPVPGPASTAAPVSRTTTLPTPTVAAPAAPLPPKTVTFTGNENLVKWLEKIAPLRGRSLGIRTAEELTRFGLEPAEASLTIRLANGQERKLEVGIATFGKGDRYVRDVATGTVYVLAKAVVADLAGAKQRFMERKLYRFDIAKELARVEIVAETGKRVAVRFGALGAPPVKWADAASPDVQDEELTNWLTKVTGLSVKEYLEGDPPMPTTASESPVRRPVVSLRYFGEAGEIGFAELVALEFGSVPTEYHARSETTKSWVLLTPSQAAAVAGDVSAIVAPAE